MTLKYKLVVVDVTEEKLVGAKHPINREHLEYVVGTFRSEESLAHWAKGNQGELAKSEQQEV